MEESRKAEVGEATKPKVGVESFADDPRPIGGMKAEMRCLKQKGEERVAGGIQDEGLGGGPAHREEEGEGCAIGLEREGNAEDGGRRRERERAWR
jgi:hypothetical protein